MASQGAVDGPDLGLRDASSSAFRPDKAALAAAQAEGQSEAQALEALLPTAARLARPPISSFSVGAVGLGASGRVYLGANIEFPRLPLHFSIHAEQCLLVNLLHAGEPCLRTLVVSAAPCGHCRQFLAELCHLEELEIVFGTPSRAYRLDTLLPQRFGPGDLLNGAARRQPLLLERQHWRLRWTEGSRGALERLEEGLREAAERALSAAATSYCPYSRHPSGVSLLLGAAGELDTPSPSRLRLASGAYLESAAFNPSLSPLHTALIDALVQGGLQEWTQVRHIVLVEYQGGSVSQEPLVRAWVGAVAPRAALTVLHASEDV